MEAATDYNSMEATEMQPQQRNVSRKLLTAGAGVVCLVVVGLTLASRALVENGLTILRSAPPIPHTGEWCEGSGAKIYTKTTLKSVVDQTIYGQLTYKASFGEKKFEASDVIRVGEHFLVVCDSSYAILNLSESLPLLSPKNSLVRHDSSFEPPDAEDSGFEAIMWDQSSPGQADYYVVRESIHHKHTGSYHAQILKIHMGETSYSVLETCRSELAFEGDSKGFEGATSIRGADGVLYLLGLCEGNFCSESRGKEVGNGRVIIMVRADDPDEPSGCVWKTVRTLEMPSAVQFVDYSALAVHHSTQAVAITSQENSQLWVSSLSTASDGQFDPMAATFAPGKVLDFPRTKGGCAAQYCNIEGIHWLSGGAEDKGLPQMLVAVSDKMKSKGRQAAVCHEKDQAVHLFAIP